MNFIETNWMNVIGRVSFANCDPLFDGLNDSWNILPAPPSWLTGHLLNRDCLVAPIPTADLCIHSTELIALKELGIASSGSVGSVLLFGRRIPSLMRDIAVPTDSSTSKTLLPWLLNKRGLEPRILDMGPDLDKMLSVCDGALLIGDRALHHAENSPELVQMDLGTEWQIETSTPMVFGVFAARRDSPINKIQSARNALLETLNRFENDRNHRLDVINRSSERVGFSKKRMSTYFENEVRNRLTSADEDGLAYFAAEVCSIGSIDWLE